MTKRFGARTVVKSLGLQVPAGEIHGFLGPNGSGKTTFIRMLCGLLKPDAGEGTCLGHDIRADPALIKREVGYMTQRFSFYEDLSVRENLDFVARLYQLPRRRQTVDAALERLGLAERGRQLAGHLSGGWKQRMALAACLIHSPKLLLLDEPTAGVDPKARREFWEEIHNLAGEGLTFLIATHYMDEAERCHRLTYLAEGRLLASGQPSEIVRKAGLTTWQATGPDLHKLAAALRGRPGVTQAVAFGESLHVSGTDASLLEESIAPLRNGPHLWRRTPPGLEEVFIHLTSEANGQAQP